MVLDNPQPVTSPQSGYACLWGRNHTDATRCALASSPSTSPGLSAGSWGTFSDRPPGRCSLFICIRSAVKPINQVPDFNDYIYTYLEVFKNLSENFW